MGGEASGHGVAKKMTLPKDPTYLIHFWRLGGKALVHMVTLAIMVVMMMTLMMRTKSNGKREGGRRRGRRERSGMDAGGKEN